MNNKVSQKGFTNLIRSIIKEEVDQLTVQALNNLISAWNQVPKNVQQSIISKKGYNSNVISQERDSALGKTAHMGGGGYSGGSSDGGSPKMLGKAANMSGGGSSSVNSGGSSTKK